MKVDCSISTGTDLGQVETASKVLHMPQLALAIEPAEAAKQIRTCLNWRDGEWREIRVCGSTVKCALVDSPERAVEAIGGLTAGPGVFATLNPVDCASLSRETCSQLRPAKSGQGAHDGAIARRTRLLIDIDAVRPSGTAATDEQLHGAMEVARVVTDHLAKLGWPAPAMALSGNGYHLYYGIDLPAGSPLVERVLGVLDKQFTSPAAKIDTTVGNASRIVRLPGCVNAKGGSGFSAHHRVARLLQAGDERTVTTEQLEAIGGHGPSVPPPMAPRPVVVFSGFDVGVFLHDRSVLHDPVEPWSGGPPGSRRWKLPVCPFNAEHKGSACVTQTPDGKAGFVCHHASCAGYAWKEFRRVVELSAPVRARAHRQPFPVEALPPVMGSLARLAPLANSANSGSMAVTSIAAAIAMVGNAVTVHPWSQWRETMAAWVACVGYSGVQKTKAHSNISEVMHAVQRQLAGGDLTEEAQFIIKDATVEQVAVLAAKQPRGLVLSCGELSAHFTGMNQYKRGGNDEAFWLSAYDGEEHSVNRVKRAALFIRRLNVGILGTIQPTVLRDLVLRMRMQDNGALARYWLVDASMDVKHFGEPDPKVSAELDDAIAEYMKLMVALRTIPLGDNPHRVVVADGPAKRLIEDFWARQDAVNRGLPPGDVEVSIRNKARGGLARIAGVFAVIRAVLAAGHDPNAVDWAGLRIDEDEVVRAEQVMEWIVEEIRGVLVMAGIQSGDERLETNDRQLRQHLKDGCLTVRDTARSSKLAPAEVERMLAGLAAAKLWGSRVIQSPNGGPGQKVWFPFGAHLIHGA